jgi:hypothetical protein
LWDFSLRLPLYRTGVFGAVQMMQFVFKEGQFLEILLYNPYQSNNGKLLQFFW